MGWGTQLGHSFGIDEPGAPAAPDTTFPIINPTNPEESSTGVDKLQPVELSITDDVGVSLSSTTINIRGDQVFDGVRFSNGWKGSTYTATATGYDFVVRPDVLDRWRGLEEVTVIVATQDTSGNAAAKTYIFTVEGSVITSHIYPMIVGQLRIEDESDNG